VYPFGETLHYAAARDNIATDTIVQDISTYLGQRGVTDATVTATEPTIEDTFMARMGAPEGEELEQGSHA
jgi:hypothetical protein